MCERVITRIKRKERSAVNNSAVVIYYATHEKRGEIVNITNIYAKAKYEAKCSTLNLAKKKKIHVFFMENIAVARMAVPVLSRKQGPSYRGKYIH